MLERSNKSSEIQMKRISFQFTDCHFATNDVWIFSNVRYRSDRNAPIRNWSPEMCTKNRLKIIIIIRIIHKSHSYTSIQKSLHSHLHLM